MSKCKGCRFAAWKRNVRGNLHADGSGRCMHPAFTTGVALPAVAHFDLQRRNDHKPTVFGGGYIWRHEPYPAECMTFEDVPS